MVRAAHAVVVPHPIAEVFAFVADDRNAPRWRERVLAVRHVAGPVGEPGAVYAETLRGPGGREVAGELRIRAASAPSRLVVDLLAGPARPSALFELTDAEGGTRVAVTLEMHPEGLLALMAGAVQRALDDQARDLDRLAAALDAEAGAAG